MMGRLCEISLNPNRQSDMRSTAKRGYECGITTRIPEIRHRFDRYSMPPPLSVDL